MKAMVRSLLSLALVSGLQQTTHAAETLGKRENVNLVAAANVVLSATYDAVNQFPKAKGVYWAVVNVDAPDMAVTNALSVRFPVPRNVKTIKILNTDSYGFLTGNAWVEISANGTVWTPVPSSFTLASGCQTLTLATAVTTRFVRVVVPEFTDNPSHRLLMARLGIYGEPGSIVEDGDIDLAAADCYASAGAVTFANSGGALAVAAAEFVKANPSPYANRVWYNVGAGHSCTYTFAESHTFASVGIFGAGPTEPTDGNMRWKLWGSTNGGADFTQLLDQTGITKGIGFYGFTPFTGNAIKFEVVSSTSTGNRFGGLYLYGPKATVPGYDEVQLVFDKRENVNLLRSPGVTITSKYAPGSGVPNDFRSKFWQVANFQAGSGNQNVFTYNLGTNRNVKKLMIRNNDSWGFITNGVLEVSHDGASWVALAAEIVTGGNTTFTLNTATNAPWVRFTATGYTDEPQRRCLISGMGLFGDYGTIAADSSINVAVADCLVDDLVTFTKTGGNLEGSFVQDAANDLGRIWYSVGQGHSCEFKFARKMNFHTFGIGSGYLSGSLDTAAGWRLLGSTNGGVTYTTTLLSQTGLQNGCRYYTFTPTVCDAVRFEITSSVGTSAFGGFYLYQTPTEPGAPKGTCVVLR